MTKTVAKIEKFNQLTISLVEYDTKRSPYSRACKSHANFACLLWCQRMSDYQPLKALSKCWLCQMFELN